MKNKTNNEIISKYYVWVDAREYEKMYEIFSSDAVYKRCEKNISGIEEIKIFYEKERKLQGRHFIKDIFSYKDCVYVRGKFSGVNKRKEDIEIEFFDYFEMNNRGKIKFRQTYLSQGFSLFE